MKQLTLSPDRVNDKPHLLTLKGKLVDPVFIRPKRISPDSLSDSSLGLSLSLSLEREEA